MVMDMSSYLCPLHVPYFHSEIRVVLSAFGKPFLVFIVGGLEPQITSQNSYLDQNIKQVYRKI